MNKNIIGGVLVVLLIAGGIYYWNKEETSGKKPKLESIENIIKSQIEAAVLLTMIEEKVPDQDGIDVVSTVDKDWSDGCLGLAEAGEMCAQVITPGFEVTVKVGEQTRVYRTNADGSDVRRAK